MLNLNNKMSLMLNKILLISNLKIIKIANLYYMINLYVNKLKYFKN